VPLPPLEDKAKETIMDVTQQRIEDEQTALWNGVAGQAWVDAQEVLDEMFRPFELLLVDAAAAASRVLDVGCGTGSTTLAVARRPGTVAVGVDISEPMLALARARAEREHARATVLGADAEAHAFEPASFDLVISRFGVMFFADPARAFANLRRAAEGGALRVIAWRSPAENPFMTTAERAAAPLLPAMPPRKADAPGQFAFADAGRVRRILEDGGWRDIDIQPIDVPCAIPRRDLARYVTRLGPVGRYLADADEQTRGRVVSTVLDAFAPYVHGDQVRYTAACWSIGARA
jgi:SAM-dependent methyltransferase